MYKRQDYHAFYRELSAFFRVKETGKVSVNDQALMLKTLSPRYTVSDLLRSYMFSQAMALPLRDVLGEYILQNTGEPDEPHWRAIGELMQTYRINYQTAESVLKRYDCLLYTSISAASRAVPRSPGPRFHSLRMFSVWVKP